MISEFYNWLESKNKGVTRASLVFFVFLYYILSFRWFYYHLNDKNTILSLFFATVLMCATIAFSGLLDSIITILFLVLAWIYAGFDEDYRS